MIRTIALTLAAATAFFMAGCAGLSTQSTVYGQCQAYASALASLALNADRLSDEAIATVDQLNALTDPICEDPDAVEDNADALRTVRNATRQLNAMEGQ